WRSRKSWTSRPSSIRGLPTPRPQTSWRASAEPSCCTASPPLRCSRLRSNAGNVSFPNASELRLAASQVPADRVLVETDSAYLAPQPVRGRPNEPANVVHTLAAVAAARDEDPSELEAQVDANANAAFGL